MAHDGRLHILVRRVQCADAFPLGGIGLEIGGGFGGARLAHGGEPRQIGLDGGRFIGGERGKRAPELRAAAAVGGAVEHPAAFLEAFQQAWLAQELQMARDARLALADDLDQLADRQFGLPEQQQQAQPGGVSRGTQHGNQRVHPDHINISLYDYAMGRSGMIANIAHLSCSGRLPDGGPAAMNLPHPARSMCGTGALQKQDTIVMRVSFLSSFGVARRAVLAGFCPSGASFDGNAGGCREPGGDIRCGQHPEGSADPQQPGDRSEPASSKRSWKG